MYVYICIYTYIYIYIHMTGLKKREVNRILRYTLAK